MTPGVIEMVAGPGLFLSYLIAAAVLIFTVLSYMDLGARYKGIGNAYVYVYASLGEFAAGLIGTFILTEMALTVTLVSVGFGQNMDKFILEGLAHQLETRYAGVFLPAYLAENVNLMAIALIMVCCIVNCLGVKQVAVTNIITVTFSFIVLTMYCICSLVYGSSKTFTDSTDPKTGRGGVFPYGFVGVIHGAAIVVVSFGGFESVVSLSAEAKNSKRDVPLAVGLSFAISVIVYVLVSAAIAYMVPWYSLKESTGIPGSLETLNLTVPKYIIIAAILLASSSVVLCSLTTLARGIMVFSEDGLIFEFLGSVADCSKVPIMATIFATAVIIFFTLAFSYHILINLVSGGTLIYFAAVCYALIVISYTQTRDQVVDESSGLIQNEVVANVASEEQPSSSLKDHNVPGYVENQEWKVVGLTAIFCVVTTIGVVLYYSFKSFSFWQVRVPLIVALGILDLMILCFIKLRYHIQLPKDPGFVCPGVPFVPAIGIVCNLALFGALDAAAHLITIAYFGVGLVTYFGYGYFNSSITLRKQKELEIEQNTDATEDTSQ
jgi:cationic amino acid transporter 4